MVFQDAVSVCVRSESWCRDDENSSKTNENGFVEHMESSILDDKKERTNERTNESVLGAWGKIRFCVVLDNHTNQPRWTRTHPN